MSREPDDGNRGGTRPGDRPLLRVQPAFARGAAPDRVVVVVRRDHYATRGLDIRQWLSPRSFVARLRPGEAERLAQDPLVASVKPEKGLDVDPSR